MDVASSSRSPSLTDILLFDFPLCPQPTPPTTKGPLLLQPLSTWQPTGVPHQTVTLATSHDRSILEGGCPQSAQCIGDIPRLLQQPLRQQP